MYITGRTSKFSVGGTDNFTSILARDGTNSTYATDSDLWNAVMDAIVAVQRKLCREVAINPVSNAASCAVDANGYVYLADDQHNRILVFDDEGSPAGVYANTTLPDGADVAVNDSDPDNVVVFAANLNNKSVDVFEADGTQKNRLQPANFKPVGVAYCDEGGEYIYVINNHTGQRKLEVYNAKTLAYKSTIATNVLRVRRSLGGLIYILQTDSSIYRVISLVPTQITNITGSINYVDIASDASGNIWLLDRVAKSIKKYNSSGVLSQTFDSVGTAWEFINPIALALDTSFNMYVADNGVIKQIDSGGNLVREFAGDALVPESVDGSCLVRGNLSPAITTSSLPLYPANTGTSRWKRIIVSSSNLVTAPSSDPLATSKDFAVEFIVNPGEIVWVSDMRISIRGSGQQAKCYFKKLPNPSANEGTFATTMPDGTVKLRYIFSLSGLSPAMPKMIGPNFIVDVLGYVSPI